MLPIPHAPRSLGLGRAGDLNDTLGLEIVRSLSDIERSVESVLAAMKQQHYPHPDAAAIRLVLHEVLTNAVRHGNRDDATKLVHLRYDVTRDWVRLEVQDDGTGFDPSAVPDPRLAQNLDKPSGRGLLLIRSLMNWVKFSDEGRRLMLFRWRTA